MSRVSPTLRLLVRLADVELFGVAALDQLLLVVDVDLLHILVERLTALSRRGRVDEEPLYLEEQVVRRAALVEQGLAVRVQVLQRLGGVDSP